MARIAFIGLGVMGAPLAGHLARAGHDLIVCNRTMAKAQHWVERYGGRLAPTPAAAAAQADIAISCVGDDGDLEKIALGDEGGDDGLLNSLKPGAIFIDHSTVSARLAQRLFDMAQARGIGALDAPISGGQPGAEAGKIVVMAGGTSETFAAAEPIMSIYARHVAHIGPAGHGQLTKMVNQICCVGIIQSLAEGMNFARTSGLDTDKVIDVVSGGAAQSWQMDNRAASMLEDRFDFGFAIDLLRKDLGLVLDEAGRRGIPTPFVALAEQFCLQAQNKGLGRQDGSALIRLLRAKN